MNWNDYPNFSEKEFRCKETGECQMDPNFLYTIQEIRNVFGPMSISSGYRSPEHSVEKRKSKPGAHASGMACDVQVYGESAWRLLRIAANLPEIRGIGVSQKGEPKHRFIHLDILPGPNRPWVWSY